MDCRLQDEASAMDLHCGMPCICTGPLQHRMDCIDPQEHDRNQHEVTARLHGAAQVSINDFSCCRTPCLGPAAHVGEAAFKCLEEQLQRTCPSHTQEIITFYEWSNYVHMIAFAGSRHTCISVLDHQFHCLYCHIHHLQPVAWVCLYEMSWSALHRRLRGYLCTGLALQRVSSMPSQRVRS